MLEIIQGHATDFVRLDGRQIGLMYFDAGEGRWYFEGLHKGMQTVSREDRDDVIDFLMAF